MDRSVKELSQPDCDDGISLSEKRMISASCRKRSSHCQSDVEEYLLWDITIWTILLEFCKKSDLCPVGCLSVIPFIYRKCCAGINNFLEYSSTKGQSDTLTALNYLARSEHVQPQGQSVY